MLMSKMRAISITQLLLCFSICALTPTAFKAGYGVSAMRNNNCQRLQLRYKIQNLRASDSQDFDANRKKTGKKGIVGIAIGSLVSVTLAAKAQILPMQAEAVYTDSMIQHDIFITLLAGVAGACFVKLCTYLAAENVLQPRDSRKVIHTLSAPVYMLFWPLFSPGGRYFAMCVPLLNAFRLYIASTGTFEEKDLAYAVSRTGEEKEALEGPFVYVIVLFFSILLFWRDNMIGISALSTMAAGDGMADMIGRRLGKGNKWFFSKSKSMAGTAAFILFSSLATVGITGWFSATGCLSLPNSIVDLVPKIVAVCSAAAFIELLPIGEDNWTVPVSSAILAAFFLNV